MAKVFSTKHALIDRSNATTMSIIAVASFVAIFSLVASRALLSQRAYQARVIAAKKQALATLKADNAAAEKLGNSYQAFLQQGGKVNIIGGLKEGKGDRDGDNAKIVLDALPSKYDFPALIVGMDKLLASTAYTHTVSGTDDELNQATKTDGNQAIEIPFQINATGNYQAIQSMIDALQQSIRPIQVLTINITGGSSVTATVSAKTYYQPEQKIDITTKDIK